MKIKTARILAGYADKNASLFRRLGVPLGDPAAWIALDERKIGLVRDLEMDRVRQAGLCDEVTCPAQHAPPAGISGDRETATAEAAAQILRAARVEEIFADRSLPFIFAWHLQQAEIIVQYDPKLGVLDRRTKSDHEIELLAQSQTVTEEVMKFALQTIAACDTAGDGTLLHEGEPMTSDRVRSIVAVEFLRRGFTMGHGAIVATAPEVADCHHSGAGPLRTGVPVIVDLFPRNEATRYWGDCTRTVVHGTVTDEVAAMHAAVVEAKAASTAALRAGSTGEAVHQAGEDVLVRHGFPISRGALTDGPSIQHGTGHGIGLDVHEPILLDHGGGEILQGEVFTIEPGLYGRLCGGVRIEDMLVVTDGEPKNLNKLPEGLTWD